MKVTTTAAPAYNTFDSQPVLSIFSSLTDIGIAHHYIAERNVGLTQKLCEIQIYSVPYSEQGWFTLDSHVISPYLLRILVSNVLYIISVLYGSLISSAMQGETQDGPQVSFSGLEACVFTSTG